MLKTVRYHQDGRDSDGYDAYNGEIRIGSLLIKINFLK